MKPDFLRKFAGPTLLAVALVGCKSSSSTRAEFPRSGYSAAYGETPAGSIADLRRKLDGEAAGRATARETTPARTAGEVWLLVVHDAQGRPVYVETRRSSGDPALDQRAQEYVLRERRFPPGAPNTVLLPLKRSEVPKK